MRTRPATRRDVDGIVLLDKPIGLSSNEALQQVRRLYNARRAGHTGSLDPLATGMLPVCLGQATKVSAYLLDADKTYRFRVRFGLRTTTGDLEGEPVATGSTAVAAPELRAAAAAMCGPSKQVPPMYSALKHEGKRLYELARAGLEVARAPRDIHISRLSVEQHESDTAILLVQCSKGTYIRTLAEDLAARVGTVGHLIELRRLSVEPFDESAVVSLPALEMAASAGQGALDALLIPMDHALTHLPVVTLSGTDAQRIRHGQAISLPGGVIVGLIRLYSAAGGFIGIGEGRPDGEVAPRRLLAEGPEATAVEPGL